MIDIDIHFHLIYYQLSLPHTVRTTGKCSYASPFYRRGTPPVHIACSLHEWIHSGDLLFCMGRSCCCANPPHWSRKSGTRFGLRTTSFCLVCSALVVVACLPVRMSLIDCLQHIALVCRCCHVLFHVGVVRYCGHIHLRGHILLRILQRCLVLQIVVVGCCTPVGIGVVSGAGRLVGGQVRRFVWFKTSSLPFGWWCLVVVDEVGLCSQKAAEEMRSFALRARWLMPSSSWTALPCVMWWYRQWYQLYCRWTPHSSWGRRICYFVRTCLVPMWPFTKLGVVGMPLGYGGVDWSTSVLLWACVPSLWDCVGIVLFVQWGQACWLGVAVLFMDFCKGSQSLGRRCIFWTGSQADPVGYRISDGSYGLYTAKKVTLFWCIVSGVGLPHAVASWSNMSCMIIVEFQPVVGGVVGGATLNALLTCSSSVS